VKKWGVLKDPLIPFLGIQGKVGGPLVAFRGVLVEEQEGKMKKGGGFCRPTGLKCLLPTD